MAGYSMDSLLVWLRDTTRLRGWDNVIALDTRQVSEGLKGIYQLNLENGVTPTVPDGSVVIPDTNISHFFSGFVSGPPGLSLRQASLEHVPLAWRVSMVGGLHTVLAREYGQNEVLRISAYEPLNSPALDMDLALASESNTLSVDLALGEGPELTIAGTETEQREAGKFFHSWLQSLSDSARVFPIVEFSATDNPLLKVRRIEARAQLENAQGVSRQTAEAQGKGALLLFVTLDYGVAGGLPDDSSDFRYLIPNDAGADYSAAMVFSSHALHRAALGHAVMEMLNSPEFFFEMPDKEPLRSMVARSGTFDVAGDSYQSADFVFESSAFSVQASDTHQPLTVDFDYGNAVHSWGFPCTLNFRYRALNSSEWQPYQEATFNVTLKHEFHLTPGEFDKDVIEGHFYCPYNHDAQVTPVAGHLVDISPAELQQINGFVAYTAKHGLLKGLAPHFRADGSETYLSGLKLCGGHGLQARAKRLPHDLAVFGRMGPDSSTLRIVAPQGVVVAGSSLQLRAEPICEGLRWSVTLPDGSHGAPGTISAQGLYQAPDTEAMGQRFHQVLISAENAVGNERATTLIAVQFHGVSLNPLIEVCNHSESVRLSARSVSGADLVWKKKDAASGGSLGPDETDPAGGQIYTAGPRVADKTYVLDEVTVSDGNDARSAWILVKQMPPSLAIRPVEDATLPEGQIRLEVLSGVDTTSLKKGERIPAKTSDEEGLVWSLPAGGPGSIDQNGVYTSASNAGDCFVLIYATWEDDFLGELAGHIILPLPLKQAAAVVKALSIKPDDQAQPVVPGV
ncbi:hypothetical protein [Pseudomonas viridiflava]|uniref:hypothetical protein n=1 Tax=Pseudomonas viridiflava TaxID=33069 RepID=UPI000F087596|nr:hypothetical protein [Pseudomonas viridiflava]